MSRYSAVVERNKQASIDEGVKKSGISFQSKMGGSADEFLERVPCLKGEQCHRSTFNRGIANLMEPG